MGKRGKRLRQQKLRAWFTDLLNATNTVEGPRRLSKRERRRLLQKQKDEEHRKDFLDYLNWVLVQPGRTA